MYTKETEEVLSLLLLFVYLWNLHLSHPYISIHILNTSLHISLGTDKENL